MAECSVRFRAHEVCAILDGRKTQARLAMKPQPDFLGSMTDPNTPFKTLDAGLHGQIMCPYGQPGDRLWVRETWCDVNLEGAPGIAYRADGDIRDLMAEPSFHDEDGAFNYDDERVKPYDFAVWSGGLLSGTEGRWRPSIHMPRWASRIMLEITAVRVERLRDITESDARAEGTYGPNPAVVGGEESEVGFPSHVDEFRYLWKSIKGPDSWDANPWVWVVEFKVVAGVCNG